jgi:hypothetical protein
MWWRDAPNMIFRSVFLVLAGISSLTLSGCKTPLYEDPPPRVRFNPDYMQTTPPPGMYGPRDTVAPVVPTDVEQPPREITQMPSAAGAAPRDFPVGTPVAGKPGFVTSPYKPYAGYVDVRGFTPGEQVKCPYSGKIFLVP